MPLDMLDRLLLDPGTRTLGELLQEREWAVSEIRHLRADVDRLSRKHHALRIEGEVDRAVDPALNAQRLLRLSEVSTMIGLGRTSIYRCLGRAVSFAGQRGLSERALETRRRSGVARPH